jgi:hypothetical protein
MIQKPPSPFPLGFTALLRSFAAGRRSSLGRHQYTDWTRQLPTGPSIPDPIPADAVPRGAVPCLSPSVIAFAPAADRPRSDVRERLRRRRAFVFRVRIADPVGPARSPSRLPSRPTFAPRGSVLFVAPPGTVTTGIRRRGRENATTGNRPYPRSPASLGSSACC